jgi:hypothetical protein
LLRLFKEKIERERGGRDAGDGEVTRLGKYEREKAISMRKTEIRERVMEGKVKEEISPRFLGK